MNGVWRTAIPELNEQAKAYLFELQKHNKTHTIWNDHCLIGSTGQAIDSKLFEALRDWESAIPGRTVKYVQKGNIASAEMYSVFGAEVPVNGLGEFNAGLAAYLDRYDHVFVAGEAYTHCVNCSVTDLMRKHPSICSKVVLIENMMSPIRIDGYEKTLKEFKKFVTDNKGKIAIDGTDAFNSIRL
jgi:nicotinamidase-related amidase